MPGGICLPASSCKRFAATDGISVGTLGRGRDKR
jgi:hypothetical protein